MNAIERTREKTQASINEYPADDPRHHALEDRLRSSELSKRVAELCKYVFRLSASLPFSLTVHIVGLMG